jgi:hypothetical protein
MYSFVNTLGAGLVADHFAQRQFAVLKRMRLKKLGDGALARLWKIRQ